MNAKHIKIQILSLMTLTIILGTLPSLSSANVLTSLSSLEPERLGEGFVSTIALNADGTVIAAAHRPKTASKFANTTTILLWDPHTREQIGELPVGNIRSIAFSPDGTLLALAGWEGDNRVHLWDLVAQNQIAVLQSSVNYGLYTVAFSPDGKTIAYFGGIDQGICLWDVQTQRQTGTLQGHSMNVRAIAFSPSGGLLASGGNRNDEAIRLWDIESQVQIGALTGHLDMTMDLAFNPDGSILASAGGDYDKAVYLWDVQSQSELGVLGGHPAHVGSVAFSPDGKLLATSSLWEPTIFLWDVQTQTQRGQLTEHDVSSGLGWGHEVVFAPDGKWLACSSGNGVEIWDLDAPSTTDFNGDGAVDIDDLLRLIESWGSDDPLVDIGPMPWGDGIIDSRDLLVMAEYMVEYESDKSGLE